MKNLNLFKFPESRPARTAAIVFCVAVTVIFHTVCVAQQMTSRNAEGIVYHLTQVKKEMKPLNLSQPPSLSTSAQKYLQFYDIYFEDIPQYLGTFESRGYDLSAHIFLPSQATATVFLLHGYCDHSGILKNLIRLWLFMISPDTGYPGDRLVRSMILLPMLIYCRILSKYAGRTCRNPIILRATAPAVQLL